MHRTALLLAALLIGRPLAAQPAAPSRTIDPDVTIRLPLVPCEIPQAVLLIARSAGVAAGVEGMPEPCPNGRSPLPASSGQMAMRGMSAGDALDALVRLDARYRWAESDVGLMTFDGGAVGGHAVFLRREDGRTYDPCNAER